MRFFLLSLLGLLSSLGVTTFRLNVRRTLADVAVGNRQRSCKLADTPSTTTPNFTVSSSPSIINDNEVPLPSYSSSKSTATSTSSRKYTRPGKVAVSVEETLRTPAAVSMDTDPSQVIFSKRFDHSSSSSGSGSNRIPGGDVAGSSYTTSSTIHGPPFKSSNRYTPTNVLGGMTGESGRKPWKSRKDPMNIESVGVYPTNFYRNVAYDHLAANSLGAIEALPAMRFSKVNLDLLSDTLSHTHLHILTGPYINYSLHRPLTSSPSPPLTVSVSLPPSPPLITLRARAI